MRRKEPVFSRMVLNNVQRERRTLSRYACKNIRGVRKDPSREKLPDRENIRPTFFHDADRIMHSLAYSRYIDKTQVFYLCENDHITHRVLHVQFVSKIGRVIGRCLRLNEDLIEAISLGHDLGHAPYGHDGNDMLHRLCRDNGIGCFYHNAQSVRFLTEIEERGEGLNLSLQVLDGILAHNGEMVSEEYAPHYEKTWTRFEEEYEDSFVEEDYVKRLVPMTLEGCVVRIADVIAYIGRDIEDAITLRLIKRKDIPREITAVLGNRNDRIINKLVLDLTRNSSDRNCLLFSKDIFRALKDLMRFNYANIYSNPRIKTQSRKIENMFTQLFARYHEDLEKHDANSDVYRLFWKDMSEEYREKTDSRRMAIDFIAGMTDDFFNNQFEKHFVPQSYGYSFKGESKGWAIP